jgi:hypothetical protein
VYLLILSAFWKKISRVVTKYFVGEIWRCFREIFISYIAKFANEIRTIFAKAKLRYFLRNFALFAKFRHFSENLANIFQDVTPVFQFNTYLIKHRNGHAAWSLTCNRTLTCTKDMDMVHGHKHRPWTWTHTMDMDMHHGNGYSPWTWTCTMDMDMRHGKGHGLWAWDMHNGHGHGHAAWTWTYSMDMDMGMQHGQGHGYAAWTGKCSVDMYRQHVQ